jgi:hypothetical protein
MTWVDSVKAMLWLASIGTALFLSAGTFDWPGAWIFIAEFVIAGLAVTLWLAWYDPGLLKERMGGPFQKGQGFWDKVFMALIIVVWYGWLVLMAFDAKRSGFSHMPKALNDIGAALPIGFLVVWVTFRENSFAAPVVRIREERGHQVDQHRAVPNRAPSNVFRRDFVHDRNAAAARIIGRPSCFAADPWRSRGRSQDAF